MTVKVKDLEKTDMRVDNRTLLRHPDNRMVMGCKEDGKRAKTCTRCRFQKVICC